MRHGLTLTALVLLIAAAGCEPTNEALAPSRSLNTWLMASIDNPQIDNAIIAQRTIYPYHFVRDTAQLNELGERDLRVLAEHFRTATGELNVHQGESDDTLYSARVAAVAEALAMAGVQADRVQIVDGLPGGDGMGAERLVKILAKEDKSDSSGGGLGFIVTGTGNR